MCFWTRKLLRGGLELPSSPAPAVLIRLNVAVMKHHGQQHLGEERVNLAYTFTSVFITEGSQDRNSNKAGTWRQELMQMPWRDAAYCLAPCGLLSLLSYRTQEHQPSPGMVPLTMCWFPHRWITSWENLMEAFSQLRVLPLRWLYFLCQVDIRLASTQLNIQYAQLKKNNFLKEVLN